MYESNYQLSQDVSTQFHVPIVDIGYTNYCTSEFTSLTATQWAPFQGLHPIYPKD